MQPSEMIRRTVYFMPFTTGCWYIMEKMHSHANDLLKNTGFLYLYEEKLDFLLQTGKI